MMTGSPPPRESTAGGGEVSPAPPTVLPSRAEPQRRGKKGVVSNTFTPPPSSL